MKKKQNCAIYLRVMNLMLLIACVSASSSEEISWALAPQTGSSPLPDSSGVGFTEEQLAAPMNIGYRTEDPGPFLHWPLPASIPRTSISVIPDSPWTEFFLGISECPEYPPMIDDYVLDGILYSGQFENYALPGTTKDRVRFLNTDNTGLLYNFFACYRATASNGLPDHAGTDISAPNGTNVLAAANASEVNVVIDAAGDYRIRLRHPDVNGSGQTWYTFYVHLSRSSYPLGTSTVSVPAGQKIGEVGQGHLHFQAATGGSYANAEARNIWGIDQAPWGGCLWVDGALCASPLGTCCGCLPAECCLAALAERSDFPTTIKWIDDRAVKRTTALALASSEPCEATHFKSPVSTADEQVAPDSSNEGAFLDAKLPIPVDAPASESLGSPAAAMNSMDFLTAGGIFVRQKAIEPQRTPPTSASFRVAKSVFGSGGGKKTSTHYIMNGTQGQTTDLSRRVSASYVLVPGYWGRWAPSTFEYAVYLPLVVGNR